MGLDMKTTGYFKTIGGTEIPIEDKAAREAMSTKQDKLVSGVNIKTINGASILGEGDIVGGKVDDVRVDGVSVVANKVANIPSYDDTEIKGEIDMKVGYAEYKEDNYLYLYSSDESEEPLARVYIKSGGGGGGDSDSVLKVTNTSGFLSKTILKDGDLTISFNWSSLKDDLPTGNGTLNIYCNNVNKGTFDIAQGEVSKNVKDYLSTGSNSVKLTITDVYGNIRTLIFTVKVIDAYITSTFDSSTAYSASIPYTYVPYGALEKTIHFVLDGTEIGSVVTAASGVQETYTIPKQAAGSHSLKVYMTATLNEQTVTSNTLQYEIICTSSESIAPIISTTCFDTTAQQYETKAIGYYVYDPSSLATDVDLIVGELIVSHLENVDRTLQIWNYTFDTVGSATLKIVCGETVKTFNITVEKSDINVQPVTADMSLYLTSKGRSNNDTNPSEWKYGTIESSLTGFNFVSNGWLHDEDNYTVMRIKDGARVTIPLQIFKDDFRTTGKTIEVEFATRDVLDYDSVIISCLSGGRGIEYTAQMVDFASEQSSMFTQYREDDHVRIAFVVEKKAENRLIYFYINGIMSGVIQYPEDDDFSQLTPVDIALGADKCTLDIYNIRVYDNDLTRKQILNNWIADSESIDDMVDRYDRNNIFDEYGQIVISQLPKDLPYMIVNAAELPQSKGDKKTVSGSYVNPSDTGKNFTFTGAEFDVQGTSSADYARKNYKGKFKGGFVLDDGTTSSTYQMRSDSIATNTFTFKADVASSEGANNVELVGLYNDTCPYKTAPQTADAKVRQGIDGFPMVIFWNDGNTVTFLGKYNFNNDKGTPEVFGFADGDESWEFKNNTSARSIFENVDFSGTDWQNDFEARYPEGYTDITDFAAVATWINSTKDNVSKFKSEFENYFELTPMVYYYVFTETFLMVDSRAKNQFMTKMGGSKWFILPYDFDTALGINNEGGLTFSYKLEDTDQVGGADVYNGQQSILWKNFRVAYADEIKAMYTTLRSGGVFNYNEVESRFETHQSKWPEAIFNEDSYYKYIQPLIESGTSTYLSMLQGSKNEQRKWWLYNRFRYMDSKYNAGDSLSDTIGLRAYAKGDITVTPYADIYASVKYGSYLVQKRANRNEEYTLECPLTTMNDTEVYVYNCSQILSIGDISPMKVGYANFSLATRLDSLKIGDSSSDYKNENLKELYLGNNTLLKTLDVRNCPNLTMAVDISGCSGIENIYFDGTAITGVSIANGAPVKVLHLPGTLTNLTLRNITTITDFTITSYENITTLRLENLNWDIIDGLGIAGTLQANSRLRLIGVTKTVTSANDISTLYDSFDTFRGLDEDGNTVDKAQISGTIYIDEISQSDYSSLKSRYSSITISYKKMVYTVKFYDEDGKYITSANADDSGNVTYPYPTPTKDETVQYTYTFAGWANSIGGEVDANALKNVTADKSLYTVFTATTKSYTITFINDTSGTEKVLQASSVKYGTTPVYSGSTPVYEGTDAEDWGDFVDWNPSVTAVTGDATYKATFKDISSVTVGIVKRSIKKYEDDELTEVKSYSFSNCAKLISVSLPAVTSIEGYAFRYCTSLTSTNFPVATSIGSYAFYYCTSLTSTNFPVATSIGSYAFSDCSSLTSIDLPAATSIGNSAFCNCSSLTSIDLHVATSISTAAFSKCSGLVTLIIRTAITVCTYATTSRSSDPSNANLKIYVPSALLDAYKSATNWSRLADHFVALEGSEFE